LEQPSTRLADPFIVQPAQANGALGAGGPGMFGLAGTALAPQAFGSAMPSLTELLTAAPGQPVAAALAGMGAGVAANGSERRVSLDPEAIQQVSGSRVR
jgi:hypothetical protein